MDMMPFFIPFGQSGMDAGVAQAGSTAGAVIVDVRTPDEYAQGHVPGAVNLPLQALDAGRAFRRVAPTPSTPIYLYCASGARSDQAARVARRAGYTNVTNMGGIASYSGKIVR